MHKDAFMTLNHLTADDAFSQATQLYTRKEYGGAIPYFLHAIRGVGNNSFHSNEYIAFYGLCLMQLGNRDEGFNKCVVAAEKELTNPEVFVYLAKAAIIMFRRKMALRAISQGLVIEPTHMELKLLRKGMGIRGKPLLGFLSRDNILNILSGKLRYKLTHN